jgi:acetyl-CoA carboxylase carboxyltransferase component
MINNNQIINVSGVAAGAFDNDIDSLTGIRHLFNYLPLSNKSQAPVRVCDDPWYAFISFQMS